MRNSNDSLGFEQKRERIASINPVETKSGEWKNHIDRNRHVFGGLLKTGGNIALQSGGLLSIAALVMVGAAVWNGVPVVDAIRTVSPFIFSGAALNFSGHAIRNHGIGEQLRSENRALLKAVDGADDSSKRTREKTAPVAPAPRLL